MIGADRRPFNISELIRTKNVVDGGLALRAALCEPTNQILLYFGMLKTHLLAAEGMPVLVIVKVGPLIQRILYGPRWALGIGPERGPKETITGHLYVVLGSVSAVVLEDVGITPRAIRHIVKRGRLLHGRRRIALALTVTLVIPLQLNAVVAHHSSLVDLIQCSIIIDNLYVAAAAISKITTMLGIERPLQISQIPIGLILVRVVHL